MNNYQNLSMDEIVFENRNKAYGAFQLRQMTEKNTAYGLLVTTSAIAVFTMIVLLLPRPAETLLPRIVHVAPTEILVEQIIPPKVIPKTITPPASTPSHATQAFTEIVASTTAPVTTEVAKQIDLASSTASISTTTNTNENTTASASIATATNTAATATTTEVPVKPAIVKWAEVMPSFVGGNDALKKYLMSHISMDSRDVEAGISGRVVIMFYVDIDGSIKDAKVVKDDAGGRCAERALAVINSMPKWIPGRQGDKPVRVYHTLPVNFQVQ